LQAKARRSRYLTTLPMRPRPDPNVSLRATVDYIRDSNLCQQAMRDSQTATVDSLVLQSTELIHRLERSCNLQEFTDHGLAHVSSVLERVCTWTITGHDGRPQLMIERLSPQESVVLLLAILFHDIGMLSQRPDDLPHPAPTWAIKGLTDISRWVRITHVLRMPGVVARGLGDSAVDATVRRALTVAATHNSWPGHPEFGALQPKDQTLAAILAAADLLDEDCNRCDFATLLSDRYGSPLSRAHWIRHGLTVDPIRIESDKVFVSLATVPGAEVAAMHPVFCALRNQFRLIQLYGPALAPIGAQNLKAEFSFPTGVPSHANADLKDWSLIPSFATASALAFQLMSTIFPIALLDRERAGAEDIQEAEKFLEPVDLTVFRRARGSGEPRSSFEQIAHALST